MTTSGKIFCTICNVPVETITIDPQPDTMVTCPRCGQSDTHENVIREAGEHYARQQISQMFKSLDSSGFEVTEHQGPLPRFIFVED